MMASVSAYASLCIYACVRLPCALTPPPPTTHTHAHTHTRYFPDVVASTNKEWKSSMHGGTALHELAMAVVAEDDNGATPNPMAPKQPTAEEQAKAVAKAEADAAVTAAAKAERVAAIAEAKAANKVRASILC